MTVKKQFLFCFLFACTIISSAYTQTRFEVPQNLDLKSKEDCAKYEPAIIEAAKWLFGSQTINIHTGEKLEKIYGKNVELLNIYVANYAKNFLENKKTATTFSATKAGLISMMNVYKKGIDITKSKEMDKLIKLTSQNKLDDYINKNLKAELMQYN